MVRSQRSKRVIHGAPGGLERAQSEEQVAEREKRALQPDPRQREQMIAVAAYFRAQRRDFVPGHELEDWLAAEAEVADRLAATR